jgi:hypothetical protein
LSDNWLHSSLAVVAESASKVLVFPSINVMGSMMGFFDFVAWKQLNTLNLTYEYIYHKHHCRIILQYPNMPILYLKQDQYCILNESTV